MRDLDHWTGPEVRGHGVDCRRYLGGEHTRNVSQLHALLVELIPAGAKVFLSATQARKLMTSVHPRDVVGKTSKRVAMEPVVVGKVYARTKAADLTERVKATGTGLLDLRGIGPSGAARLLVEVGDITRFLDRGHFASGPAPHPSTPPPGTRSGTGSPEEATARSTESCTSWPSSSCATPPKDVPTSTARTRRARPRWKPCDV
ncbi:MAG TPA: transposase [Nocardioides sp.]|nr:transposase [Nocardioides sp.]HET6652283.1 transposase [Nocardioides sp.]